MSKLKAGDRVRVYGFDPKDAGKSFTRIIVDTNPGDGTLETAAGEYVHPKQCRRLKPKAKSVRVTRDDLMKAWPWGVGNSPAFVAFCRALGLDKE